MFIDHLLGAGNPKLKYIRLVFWSFKTVRVEEYKVETVYAQRKVLSLVASDILSWIIIYLEGYPGHGRRFSSTPGLYPLDACSILTPS